MKLTKCLPKIVTSLLSLLDLFIVTVLYVSVLEQWPPSKTSYADYLIIGSWACWYCYVLYLQLWFLFDVCASYVYYYPALCVLRLVFNVLMMLFLAILGLFVARASQAKVLADVMSSLSGPLFENALASLEIRLTADNARHVIGGMLLVLFCYSVLLVAQLALLLHCVMQSKSTNVSGTSITTTGKKKAAAKKEGGDANTGLLDV